MNLFPLYVHCFYQLLCFGKCNLLCTYMRKQFECNLHYRYFPMIKLWLMMRGQLVFARTLRDLIKFDWCFPTSNMQQYYILKNKPFFENIYRRFYNCCLFWSQKAIRENKITIKTTANIY